MNVEKTDLKEQVDKKQFHMPRILIVYDMLVYLIAAVLLLVLYEGNDKLTTSGIFQQVVLSAGCIFAVRMAGKIYGQVWRYGGIQCYIRLLSTETNAFIIYLFMGLFLPGEKITFARMLSVSCLNLLGALAIRMLYRYAYKCGNQESKWGKFLNSVLYFFSGIEPGNEKENRKIKVAIIGAGRVGVGLAEDLISNEQSSYVPRCFIDVSKEKIGREIHGIPVWTEDDVTVKKLADYEIVYAQGCPILSEDVKLEGFANYTEEKFSQEDCEKMKEEALRAAKEADVVVLAIGEHFLQSGEATSKGIIEIPKIQQELFEALSEVNSEIAVVLFNGRPLDIRILEERAKAILEVWMPGTMGGAAIVEVLRGAVSPAGKLPMSFPYCVSQVPVHYDEFPTGRRHHPGKDQDRYVSKYLDMPNKPLYSFGYGLTYTQFEISDLELSKTVMKPGESVTVSVKVKNTGDREGTETLQLYIHDIAGSVVRPVKQLKGFERVILNAGEEKEVCFTVDEKMLRFLRADNTFGSEPGKFEVFIGNSSEVEECKVFELLKG